MLVNRIRSRDPTAKPKQKNSIEQDNREYGSEGEDRGQGNRLETVSVLIDKDVRVPDT